MSEIVRVEETRRGRRRKWHPANPLSSMTLRGMRQPKPVGKIDADTPEALALAVYRYKRRVRYPVRVYLVGVEVYALAETYAITEQADHNPNADLIGTYTRRASLDDIAEDMATVMAEMLARVGTAAG